MPYPYFKSPGTALLFSLALLIGAPVLSARPAAPAPVNQESTQASAYYHFSLGHLYEELAQAYGNRSDYINKAIDNYRLAMKEDPNASFLVKDIAELYRISGRIREAVEEAQSAL
ncbi:MAG: hypothetical protein JO061_19800, partial [Acidobacteriaceae bacterium]|nr:hypothetical protein [Acidobacteriaceae bacterium]